MKFFQIAAFISYGLTNAALCLGLIQPYYAAKPALRQTAVDLVKMDFVASFCASFVMSCVIKVIELIPGQVSPELAGVLGWSLQFLIQVRSGISCYHWFSFRFQSE